MATKTITSGQNETLVGTNKTKLYTSTRITYTLDENGKIDQNSVKHEILYRSAPLGSPSVAATRTGSSGDWTFLNKPFSNNPILGPDAQKSLKEGALKTTTNQQIKLSAQKEGLTPEQTKAISSPSNSATTTPTEEQTAAQQDLEKELSKDIKARKEYDPLLRYPEKLNTDLQDCIKFSILKYTPRGFGPNGPTREIELGTNKGQVVPGIKGDIKSVLGSVVLPIPGNIGDSNNVDWMDDRLDVLSQAFSDIAKGFLTQGSEGAEKSTQSHTGRALQDSSATKEGLVGKFVELAVGSQNSLQRSSGAMFNPNLELLFTGPRLRSFTFTFRLSPRSESEAVIVRKIIRFFKQGMSAQRNISNLLLRSPNTFAISYVTSNKQHPYLNRFKECALTGCSVNYTPDGNYMTYAGNERSMTSYEMQLTFQELEPIFNDDYTGLDTDNDTIIGY